MLYNWDWSSINNTRATQLSKRRRLDPSSLLSYILYDIVDHKLKHVQIGPTELVIRARDNPMTVTGRIRGRSFEREHEEEADDREDNNHDNGLSQNIQMECLPE